MPYRPNILPPLLLVLLTVSINAPARSNRVDAWPADSGTEIGQIGEPGHLPEYYEPSGAVWHPGRQTLVVVSDSGLVSEMDASGENLTTWEVPGDLEGVTLIDPEGDLVYLAVEQPDGVLEFSLATGQTTGNHWDLTDWMDGPSNLGIEALTYVDGLFYAGLQNDGRIFVFRLLPGGIVQHIDDFASPGGRDDISGMHHDPCTDVLFAIYDLYDVIVEMSRDGTPLREYELAGANQEGAALIGGGDTNQTTIFLAQDDGEIWRYEGYPVDPCPHTAVNPGQELERPSQFTCYPNPFNPRTTISFVLPERAPLDLAIFDLQGRRLRQLVSGATDRGAHTVTWHGRDDSGVELPSGIYLARLVAGAEQPRTWKLTVLR